MSLWKRPLSLLSVFSSLLLIKVGNPRLWVLARFIFGLGFYFGTLDSQTHSEFINWTGTFWLWTLPMIVFSNQHDNSFCLIFVCFIYEKFFFQKRVFPTIDWFWNPLMGFDWLLLISLWLNLLYLFLTWFIRIELVILISLAVWLIPFPYFHKPCTIRLLP